MENSHRADWLASGSFGLMVHYLITPPGDTTLERTLNFNSIINKFDCNNFIDQFKMTGADWLIFTIGQNTGYYCSPNAWLDAILPGHTSYRDLAGEIAQCLHRLGKRFIAYLPAEVTGQSPEIQAAFGMGVNSDWNEFQKRSESFIRAYAWQLSGLIDGWWYDGCWIEPQRFGDWQTWMAASRAGNPQAIVAVSPGPADQPMTPSQDYLAGETYRLPPPSLPQSRFVDGVQWHALLPVDSNFCDITPLSYADDTLLDWMRACKRVGGAVTLNVPIDVAGNIPENTLAQLIRISANV